MINHDIFAILPLAVSPTILISAAGLLLLMLNNRFVHSADRARSLHAEAEKAQGEERKNLEAQIKIIWRRASLLRLSIEFVAASVMFSGLLVVVLFVGAFLGADLYLASSVLFIAALVCIVAGIAVFLLEVYKVLTALGFELDIK